MVALLALAVPAVSGHDRDGEVGRPAASEGGGIDHEAVADVAVDDPVVGDVDLIRAYDLDISPQAVLGTEIQHFLGLAYATD